MILSTADLDKACIVYLRKRGVDPVWWERGTPEMKEGTREEIIEIMQLALGERIYLAEMVGNE